MEKVNEVVRDVLVGRDDDEKTVVLDIMCRLQLSPEDAKAVAGALIEQAESMRTLRDAGPSRILPRR